MDGPLEKRRYGLADRRDAICNMLAEAYTNNKIELEDYETRLDLAYRAESIEDLEQVIRDFPGVPNTAEFARGGNLNEPTGDDASPETKVAIIGDQTIDLRDISGRHLRSVAIIGDITIHLEHVPPQPQPIVISIFNVIGDTTVVIPRGMRVKNKIFNVLGDVEYRRNEDSVLDDTKGVCIIDGFSLIGDVTIVEEGYRKKGFFQRLRR